MDEQSTTTPDEAAYKDNIRLECLKLAHSVGDTYAGGDWVVGLARLYADFVFGNSDAEIVRATSEPAEMAAVGE